MEVDGIKALKLWRKIKRTETDKDGIIVGGRLILTLKNYGTPGEMAKVRYVAQGYNFKEKSYNVHDMATLRAASIRLILSTSAYHRFRLFSHDFTQTYLQSKYELSRNIYIQSKEEDLQLFNVQKEELLQLTKPLHVVYETGYYWGITIDEHLIKDYKFLPAPGDSALHVRIEDGKLIGVTGSYVDASFNG